ncbi:MAG: phage BR0599 family protein [Sedimentisphaerales bacterium]|nr:phage BR0599 family protein [Sedimentisphaerales bacterium]
MTYESSEISVASGQPIELNDIAMGLTHWRLTSGSEDVEFLGHTYESAPCKRSEIEQTGEIPKDGLEVELPRGHSLGSICVAGVPEEEVTLTIYRGHGTFFVTYWRGFMTRFKFNDKAIPVCYVEPASSDLPFVGGRRRCMRLCGHKLFGYRCGLDCEDYKITGTIDTISGVTITATEFGASPYDFGHGGEIVVGTAGRTIVSHTGVTITINRPFGAAVAVDDAFSAYPGCEHTPTGCGVYLNESNYGGQKFLPTKNLYAGDLIY